MADYRRYRSTRYIEAKERPNGDYYTREGQVIAREGFQRDWEVLPDKAFDSSPAAGPSCPLPAPTQSSGEEY